MLLSARVLALAFALMLGAPPIAAAPAGGGAAANLESLDADVAKILTDARLDMSRLAPCNLDNLGHLARAMAVYDQQLAMHQAWVTNRLMDMSNRLNEIFSDLHALMPPGADPLYEGLKNGLAATGLVPGFGTIAFGAATAIQGLEAYAKYHNAAQAAGIAEGILQNAQAQVDAFNDALRIHNDIAAGRGEIRGYRERIQRLLDTYEERCIKRTTGAWDEPAQAINDYSQAVPDGGPQAYADAARRAFEAVDDCDLAALARLNGELAALAGAATDRLGQIFTELSAAAQQLDQTLSQLSEHLPQPPDLGSEALSLLAGVPGGLPGASAGISAASYAAGTTLQGLNYVNAPDAQGAAAGLQAQANAQIEAMNALIAENNALVEALKTIDGYQKQVAELIRTWEERCRKGAPSVQDTGQVRIGSDAQTWCNYGGGTTAVPFPPGGLLFPVPPDGPSTPVPPGGPGIPVPPGGPSTPVPPGGPVVPGGPDQPGGTPPQDPGTPSGPGGGLVGIPVPPGGGQDGGTRPPQPPEPPDEPPPAPPTVVIIVKAKAHPGVQSAALADTTLKLDLDPVPALPGTPGATRPQVADGGGEPVMGQLDRNGEATLEVPQEDLRRLGMVGYGPVSVELDTQPMDGVVVSGGAEAVKLGPDFDAYPQRTFTVGARTYTAVLFPDTDAGRIETLLAGLPPGTVVIVDYCRDKQAGADPYATSRGTWGQDYADQWALERLGLPGADGAWAALGNGAQPVTVAVVDTGLDWNHPDITWESLWRNPGEIPDNGVDDDGNGYVDDVIGWNFWDRNALPWDRDGHGTFVTGLIAASTGNGVGIAGVAPPARIMVLKALNAFGHTRASYLAEAIAYAADHGARVINVSVGGQNVTPLEQEAVAYARSKGALVVIAAGNEGVNVESFGPAGNADALIVSASDVRDRRAGFSNWGPGVDLAAPGMDILSLRARRTDLMRGIAGIEYAPGSAYVGADRLYYRTSGTSFAAPLAAGVAALVLARDPALTPDDLERILKHAARDIETPGVDQYTGYGLLDARAALAADPKFEINAAITGLAVTQQEGAQAVQVTGSATADQFAGAVVEIGAGEAPQSWTPVGEVAAPVAGGVLVAIPAQSFAGSTRWTVRVVVRHANGRTREARFALNLG